MIIPLEIWIVMFSLILWDLWKTLFLGLVDYSFYCLLFFFLDCTDVYQWANSMSKMKIRVCLFFSMETWSRLVVWFLSDLWFMECLVYYHSSSFLRAYFYVFLLFYLSAIFVSEILHFNKEYFHHIPSWCVIIIVLSLSLSLSLSIYIYIYIYIYIHTHTHTYTYIHMCVWYCINSCCKLF